MKLYPNSQSRAVCEKCYVRCLRMYSDEFGGRTTYVICPICRNGDPQLDLDDCGLTENQLEDNLRFVRFMNGDDPDSPVRIE